VLVHGCLRGPVGCRPIPTLCAQPATPNRHNGERRGHDRFGQRSTADLGARTHRRTASTWVATGAVVDPPRHPVRNRLRLGLSGDEEQRRRRRAPSCPGSCQPGLSGRAARTGRGIGRTHGYCVRVKESPDEPPSRASRCRYAEREHQQGSDRRHPIGTFVRGAMIKVPMQCAMMAAAISEADQYQPRPRSMDWPRRCHSLRRRS
jgi:hypothetical protein